MHYAVGNYSLNDTETNGNRTIRFSWMDTRFDEGLSLAFGNKMNCHVYFLDGETGLFYMYDKPTVFDSNEEIRDWVVEK